ncbi:MAG: hypothetical protein L0Y45_06720 [Woeseiaceae bacterium]|nr:hypothetical protein [Woeseiaceae bacterium]
MKLRVLNNSIRLRLSRPEVDQAAAEGIVRGVVRFPGGADFQYVLESSPASVECAATFADAALTVRLPQSDVQSWAESGAVSITGEQRLDDGSKLDILVEKDFACLAPRESEDDSDKFPHPQADAKNC